MLEIMDSDGSEEEEILILPSASTGVTQASEIGEGESKMLSKWPGASHRRTSSGLTPSPTKLTDLESAVNSIRRQSSLPPSSPGYDADKLSFSKVQKLPVLSKKDNRLKQARTKSYSGLPQAALFSDGSDDFGFRESALRACEFQREFNADDEQTEQSEAYKNDLQTDIPHSRASRVHGEASLTSTIPDASAVAGALQKSAFAAPAELIVGFSDSEIHTGLTASDDQSDYGRESLKSLAQASLEQDLLDELSHELEPTKNSRTADSDLLPTQSMLDPELKSTQSMTSLGSYSPLRTDVKKDKRKRKRKDKLEQLTRDATIARGELSKKSKKSKRRKAETKSEERVLTPEHDLDSPLQQNMSDGIVVLVSPPAKQETHDQPLSSHFKEETLAATVPKEHEPAEDTERKPLSETPPNTSPQKPKKAPHSPLNSSKVPFRVGLSKRRSVPSLLTIRK